MDMAFRLRRSGGDFAEAVGEEGEVTHLTSKLPRESSHL
jgi:hypothetical protein